jgi:hypothetical protein
MKSTLTQALESARADYTGRVGNARLRYLTLGDGALLVASEAVLREAREVYAEQSAALDKLRAMAGEPPVTPHGDVTEAPAPPAAGRPAWDYAAGHAEAERADWDRLNEGDRFE